MDDLRNQHVVVRQALSTKVFCGVIGTLGGGLAVAGLISGALDKSLTLTFVAEVAVLFVGSAGLALHYATTEVHATFTRLWLKRYGVTWWSIDMRDAGTTEGKGADWQTIFVFDLKTGKRVGKFGWFTLDRRDLVKFSEFVDQAREAHGVHFPSTEP